MLEDLFKNNKLEYIHINTKRYNNVVRTITISCNIEKLRYFYIEKYDRVDITLDISKEYPKKL